MPNWVCNHLTIHGENAVEVMRSLLIEDKDNACGYSFDFNRIVPMPEDLNIISGSITTNCAKLYINSILEDTNAFMKYARLYSIAFGRDFILTESEQEQLMNDALKYKDYENDKLLFATRYNVYAYGKKALDNYEKYGAKDWYDWCRDNWGTKWNACNTQVDDFNTAEFYFDTAWAPIPELMAKLAEQYPECQFEYEYAEEQAGLYTGYRSYKNGILFDSEDYPECSKKAYETYFSLWGMDDSYKYNEELGTYEYVETEEVM